MENIYIEIVTKICERLPELEFKDVMKVINLSQPEIENERDMQSYIEGFIKGYLLQKRSH